MTVTKSRDACCEAAWLQREEEVKADVEEEEEEEERGFKHSERRRKRSEVYSRTKNIVGGVV